MRDLVAGLRLALTTFTVLPVRAGRVDRAAATRAMALAPLVGLALGAALAGAGIGLRALHGPPLVAAVIVVGLGALLTRGLHLDGLADTVDGLGSYRDAEGTLAIMKKPDVGPFGVAAIVLVLLAQTAALTTLLGRPAWPSFIAVTVAVATGRLAVAVACRRGVPAARPEGLGALVAGTVPDVAVALWIVLLAAVAVFASPPPQGPGLHAGQPAVFSLSTLGSSAALHGPVAVVVGLAAAAALVAHVTRRVGGITGDVLGACVELSTCLTALTLAI